jgi:putative two-component system response regulator
MPLREQAPSQPKTKWLLFYPFGEIMPASLSQSESKSATILIVDDLPQNLSILGELLQGDYRVRAVNSGERALRAARSDPRPDLILLDVMMPVMDGREVLRQLLGDESTRDIPVIFITAMSASEDEEMGLQLGAVDYITKPFNPAIVRARVRTQLELKWTRDRLSRQNEWLEHEVQRRMGENLLIQDLAIRTLACLGEARDNETGHHIIRTQSYVELLGQYLQHHPRFAADLTPSQLARIVKAAPLHDIGKVGIPDAILLKPGRLTSEEFAIMQQHPLIGADAINKAMTLSLASADERIIDESTGAFDFLQVAREICLSHHEKWDGSGYPYHLAGDAIPVSGRLMALADVFDALISQRVYKPPMSLEETTQILLEGRGRHFDPDIVDAYLVLREQFAEIAHQFSDPCNN